VSATQPVVVVVVVVVGGLLIDCLRVDILRFPLQVKNSPQKHSIEWNCR